MNLDWYMSNATLSPAMPATGRFNPMPALQNSEPNSIDSHCGPWDDGGRKAPKIVFGPPIASIWGRFCSTLHAIWDIASSHTSTWWDNGEVLSARQKQQLFDSKWEVKLIYSTMSEIHSGKLSWHTHVWGNVQFNQPSDSIKQKTKNDISPDLRTLTGGMKHFLPLAQEWEKLAYFSKDMQKSISYMLYDAHRSNILQRSCSYFHMEYRIIES